MFPILDHWFKGKNGKVKKIKLSVQKWGLQIIDQVWEKLQISNDISSALKVCSLKFKS